MLAQRAEAAAELATMYTTLLRETGDREAAIELCKAWIDGLFSTLRPPLPPAA